MFLAANNAAWKCLSRWYDGIIIAFWNILIKQHVYKSIPVPRIIMKVVCTCWRMCVHVASVELWLAIRMGNGKRDQLTTNITNETGSELRGVAWRSDTHTHRHWQAAGLQEYPGTRTRSQAPVRSPNPDDICANSRAAFVIITYWQLVRGLNWPPSLYLDDLF